MRFEVGKKYKLGNTVVEVKFIDSSGDAWGLTDKSLARCIISTDRAWQEVTDTPDPGEGWRLLEPDEVLQAGDEWWCDEDESWIVTLQVGHKQGVDHVYRRRIKPDPGEGWRLLDVGERLEEGDQFYNSVADWVGACLTWSSGVVLKGSVYRRRIAQQYVPYTWEDRGEIVGMSWFRLKDSPHIECKVLEFTKSGEYLKINGIDSRQFLKDYEWIDGTPCGKKVE